MRESNAIFPEIKYDLRKCLECDDIFTPAYRHPHQKFCKNPKFPIKILIIHQSAFFSKNLCGFIPESSTINDQSHSTK